MVELQVKGAIIASDVRAPKQPGVWSRVVAAQNAPKPCRSARAWVPSALSFTQNPMGCKKRSLLTEST